MSLMLLYKLVATDLIVFLIVTHLLSVCLYIFKEILLEFILVVFFIKVNLQKEICFPGWSHLSSDHL